MSVSALIVDFLEYLELERNASPLTIRNYDHYLKRFLDFVYSTSSGEKKDIDPSEIDLELIRKYRLYLSRYVDGKTKKGLKRVTQNYFMIALRAFLRYLARIDIATLSPEKIELGETEDRPLKVLSDEQLRQLLNAPRETDKNGIRDKSILETLFSTGLRVSELASLDRDKINLERREFSVTGKGGKIRIVFLSQEAVDALNKFLKVRNDTFKPLFIRFQGKVAIDEDGEAMRLSPRSIERIVEKYVKQLGLSVKATPHTLRHGFATDLLINGADIRSVQEMLGHDNISTTQIYTHVTNKQLKNVHKTFHSGNKTDL